MKNPPRQSARRVSENLLGSSTSSLAVFYVEQVALNRHVRRHIRLPFFMLHSWKLVKVKALRALGPASEWSFTPPLLSNKATTYVPTPETPRRIQLHRNIPLLKLV